jgi:hypothetical protein
MNWLGPLLAEGLAITLTFVVIHLWNRARR